MIFPDAALVRADGETLYHQVCETLASAIARGELRDGERLPSERELARRLGISRTTAVNAYNELTARGLVRGQVGRGTFVCATPERDGAPFAWRGKVALGARRVLDPALPTLVRASADPDITSFAAGTSALDLFPTDHYRAATERMLALGPATALGLSPTEGHPRLRATIAARAGIRPEEVLIVAGAQQGLDLIARCLLDPGDVVVMDRPGYVGAIQAFRAAGALLVGWDIRRADFAELDELLTRYRPKLLYTNPTFHNPTGCTLSRRDRRELLDLAARHRLPIVEDDPYRDLAFASPPPSLRSLDESGSVIHVGTFSKTLAGGLRLGWLAAAPAIVGQLTLVKGRGDVCSPTLTQLVVAELIAGGCLDAHLTRLREEHERRQRAMLAALRRYLAPGVLECAAAPGGLYLWCRLGPGLDADALGEAALTIGTAVAPGTLFYPDGAGRGDVRLCYAAHPPAVIDHGVGRLATAINRLQEADRPSPTETVLAR